MRGPVSNRRLTVFYAIASQSWRSDYNQFVQKESVMPEKRELTEEEKAYKPITENPIRIDLKE